jgi:uracil-DNA glycosylase
MSTKPTIIGQAPARSAKPDMRPFDSASGKRLAKWMGTEHAHMLELFHTDNLNVHLLGTNGKYDMFDMDVARARAEELRATWLTHPPLFAVLCGQKVAKAWPLRMPEKYTWYRDATGVLCAWMPHPGGTNMHWNQPENVTRAEEFLHDVLRQAERNKTAA